MSEIHQEVSQKEPKEARHALKPSASKLSLPKGFDKVLKGYRAIGKVGEGTTGVVYIVEKISNPAEKCAIKAFKVNNRKDGVCMAALREIALLREFQHMNILQMNKVHICQKERAIFLSYEYAGHDLKQIIRYHASKKRKMPHYTVKSIMWQILNGLEYLHSNWVIHRDLKPSNVLIKSKGNQQGHTKIGDFGLARIFQGSLEPLSSNGLVVSQWYRAPELLLGVEHYTPAVDIWSAGCIFGEILRLRPLFVAEEVKGSHVFQNKQMQRIIEALGHPASRWPSLVETYHWRNNTDNIQNFKPTKNKRRKLETMLCLDANSPELQLLKRMLEYDPQKRITAAEALSDKYFATEPFPGRNCFYEDEEIVRRSPYPEKTQSMKRKKASK